VVAAVAILAASCTDDRADKGESEVLPSTDHRPTEGWRTSTPEKQGMDSATLVEMMPIVREEGKNIDSITIIRNGYLVTDASAFPYGNDFKHILHSCTKSITSILVGTAIDKGYIENVDQPVTEFFPDKLFVRTCR
jgi:hypothetical protein